MDKTNEELKRENMELREQVKRLQNELVKSQRVMEVEGECITNKLLTDIEKLKNDKIVLAQRSEVEEEFITNSLQRKLSEVTEEKEKLRQKINSSTPCTSPVKVCPEVQANPESPFLPHPQTESNTSRLTVVDDHANENNSKELIAKLEAKIAKLQEENKALREELLKQNN